MSGNIGSSRYLREGSSGGCGANEWALMAPSSADFIDKAYWAIEGLAYENPLQTAIPVWMLVWVV